MMRTLKIYMIRRQWHPTPVLLPGKSHGRRSLSAVHGVAGSRTRLSNFTFTFHFHALEKKMATHSTVLAWRIPGTGEPGGLPSLGSHRVGHDWSDLAAAALIYAIYHYYLQSPCCILYPHDIYFVTDLWTFDPIKLTPQPLPVPTTDLFPASMSSVVLRFHI